MQTHEDQLSAKAVHPGGFPLLSLSASLAGCRGTPFSATSTDPLPSLWRVSLATEIPQNSHKSNLCPVKECPGGRSLDYRQGMADWRSVY
jgi:hypothetical protein